MATTAFHINREDVAVARVQVLSVEPRYSYIVVDLDSPGGVSLFLPDGNAGPKYARALAAELNRVADEFEALVPLPADVAPEPTPEPVAAASSQEDEIVF